MTTQCEAKILVTYDVGAGTIARCEVPSVSILHMYSTCLVYTSCTCSLRKGKDKEAVRLVPPPVCLGCSQRNASDPRYIEIEDSWCHQSMPCIQDQRRKLIDPEMDGDGRSGRTHRIVSVRPRHHGRCGPALRASTAIRKGLGSLGALRRYAVSLCVIRKDPGKSTHPVCELLIRGDSVRNSEIRRRIAGLVIVRRRLEEFSRHDGNTLLHQHTHELASVAHSLYSHPEEHAAVARKARTQIRNARPCQLMCKGKNATKWRKVTDTYLSGMTHSASPERCASHAPAREFALER